MKRGKSLLTNSFLQYIMALGGAFYAKKKQITYSSRLFWYSKRL